MACDIFVFSGCIFIETAHAGYLYVSALWFSLSLETRCTVLSRPIFNLSNSVFYENIWIYVMNIQPSSFLQSGYGKHLFKCIIITVTVFCIDLDPTWSRKNVAYRLSFYLYTTQQTFWEHIFRQNNTVFTSTFILFVKKMAQTQSDIRESRKFFQGRPER